MTSVRFALQPSSSDNRKTATHAKVTFSDYLHRTPVMLGWRQEGPTPAPRADVSMAGASVQKRLLTVSELSTYLGMPKNSIYTMVCLKKLPGVVHLGRSLRFEKAAIDAWINERLEAPRRA